MIDVLDQLSRVNMAQAPNYRMMVALRDAFVNYGVPRATAELLVSKMKISVSEQAVNDAELVRRVCEAYGVLVGDLYVMISKDFESTPDQVLLAMAGQLSITMEF
jgi:pyrroline-5-carboxylate reductase